MPGFESEVVRLRDQSEARVAAVVAALEASPAIIVDSELYILSPEISHPEDGEWRLTSFMADGPWGHDTRATVRDLAKLVADRRPKSVRPATEAEVISWTSTPEFVLGSKRVAFIQAINALSYASRGGDYETFRQIEHRAHEMFERDPDGAIELVQSALPRTNPTTRASAGLTDNPAWVTRSLAESYEVLEDQVPGKWMPMLSSVRAQRGRITARMKELGCGAYGCVLPTLDPGIVLKVTTDPTEAEFAAELADTLVVPVVVEYKMVVRLAAKFQGRTIYLLWREAADQVGEISHPAIDRQHAAAQDVYTTLVHGGTPKREMAAWFAAVDQMAKDDRLRYLAEGLVRVYLEQGIFFGDLHSGNLGVVRRDGKPTWVVTDPGHVSVTDTGR